MEYDAIWKKFLATVKKEIDYINYETWFEDTHLIDIQNGCARVGVPMPIYKKYLTESFGSIVSKIFNEVTESNFKIEYYTEEELNNNIVIDINEIGIVNIENEFDTNLENKYTFESFLVGKSNKFAKVNAVAVAERPGEIYNPLFIYGPSGVGKTHLMQAIGNYITQNSNKKVLYVTCEKFVQDFLKIYRDKNENKNIIDEFKNKYRSIDVLIIDDIQYLEIAAGTQQEFFNTFNELNSKNKQIIISSDKSPNDLKKLEDRLRTRFIGGLTVDILPPDFDLRMDIINNKLKKHEIVVKFPEDVKEYIAGICTSDVRKLEGCITRILSYASIMNGSNIDLALAEDALKGYITYSVVSKNKIDNVMQIVALKYNTSIDNLKSRSRLYSISYPRQVAMYICRKYLNESLAKIGNEFGNKDHTTVMHSVNKITKEIKKNKQLEDEIQKIVKQIS